jgi:hypothetical protein
MVSSKKHYCDSLKGVWSALQKPGPGTLHACSEQLLCMCMHLDPFRYVFHTLKHNVTFLPAGSLVWGPSQHGQRAPWFLLKPHRSSTPLRVCDDRCSQPQPTRRQHGACRNCRYYAYSPRRRCGSQHRCTSCS